ncbi:Palmitoyltransferase ERF2 [Cucumispora dikerogammari]|nr:Palmitoyltransferase ERF2 [Cucumispora dikerogammari]
MYKTITLATAFLIYMSNLSLLKSPSLIYFMIITLIFSLNVYLYSLYKKQLKQKTPDLESLIESIMDSYKSARTSNSNSKKICGECRKDKNEGYTHCYECQTCILNKDHHCIWLDSCINEDNWTLFNAMILVQSILCFNGMYRSIILLDTDNVLIEGWCLVVFTFNFVVGLFLGFILCSSALKIVREWREKRKVRGYIEDKKTERKKLSELEEKVGHGFSRVTVI